MRRSNRSQLLRFVLLAALALGAASGGNAAADSLEVPLPRHAAQSHPLWSTGLRLEGEDQFLESSIVYEKIAASVPQDSYIYWRVARNYWRLGDGLPVDAKAERLEYFELAKDWADRGLAVDAECAACMLWKASSIGREATTKGVLSGASNVSTLADLLERGIEARPDHADSEDNSTLGNLYYASAVLYRVLPDWWWLRWVIGVNGDKERSLEYIRNAVALSGARVDYRVELGAVLTCMGVTREEPERVAEGRAVLSNARAMPPLYAHDVIDQGHAEILIEQPDLACGYSRDGFIDLAGAELQMRQDTFSRNLDTGAAKRDAPAQVSAGPGKE